MKICITKTKGEFKKTSETHHVSPKVLCHSAYNTCIMIMI